MSFLTARMSPVSVSAGILDHLLFDGIQPLLELVHLGAVLIDHGVDDAVQQPHRTFRQDMVGAAAQLGDVQRCCAAGRREW